MRLSRIDSLFRKIISVEDLRTDIINEVADYRVALGRKGGSTPIIMDEDLKNLVLTAHDIRVLCNAYLEKEFNQWELNYIAEGLLLSSKVSLEDDKVESALYSLADPDFFSLVNVEYIHEILQQLNF